MMGTNLFGPEIPPELQVPHEYGPSTVGHGEAQCKWCRGTNRENAVVAPNHCAQRAAQDIRRASGSLHLLKDLPSTSCGICGVKLNAAMRFTDDRLYHATSTDRCKAAPADPREHRPLPNIAFADPCEPKPTGQQAQIARCARCLSTEHHVSDCPEQGN